MNPKKKPKQKSKTRRKPMTQMTPVAEQPKMCPKNRDLINLIDSRQVSITDRAQNVTYALAEGGLDYVPAISRLIMDRDEAGSVNEMLKTLGHEPLVTERYLGPAKLNGVGNLACAISGVKYAWVTSKDSVSCIPCDVKDLKVGDLVAISPKVSRIVAKDGDLMSTGSVATVESLPESTPGQVVVKIAEMMQVAWIHHKLLEKTLLDRPLEVGERVIYDERHRFVLARANTETQGNELLADLNSLETVHRHQVGSPHPIAEQVVNHFRDAIEHPEWLKQLGSRDRKGYLFIGQTGGGKSYHIKLIATEVHDLVEQVSGKRQSRVFICDASQFWSPYFGETEQKINSWAKKIAKLGSQKVIDRDGQEVAMPILGVIEECEALFRSRGGDQHASGHLFDRVLSLLLQKLESAESALGVPIVWVCSTNRPDLIDAAAMRRIGMRKAIFGNLTAEAASAVMLTKTVDLQVKDIGAEVIYYLYGSEEGQALAKVSFQGQFKDRMLHRRDLVTPAILEDAVSSAVDQCLTKSREAKKLQKVSAADVIEFLDKHFQHLSRTITAENLPDHCPEWFAEDANPVASVKAVR